MSNNLRNGTLEIPEVPDYNEQMVENAWAYFVSNVLHSLTIAICVIIGAVSSAIVSYITYINRSIQLLPTANAEEIDGNNINCIEDEVDDCYELNQHGYADSNSDNYSNIGLLGNILYENF